MNSRFNRAYFFFAGWRKRLKTKNRRIKFEQEWCIELIPPLDKMATISQMTISNAFSWMKYFVFSFQLHWSLFKRVQLTLNQHGFRKWLGAEQATSHYLNQCWPSSLAHICGNRGRWVIKTTQLYTKTRGGSHDKKMICPTFVVD